MLSIYLHSNTTQKKYTSRLNKEDNRLDNMLWNIKFRGTSNSSSHQFADYCLDFELQKYVNESFSE